MDSKDILKFLPPVLLGFGGVLPFLIGSASFYVTEEFRVLLSTIFILIVWVGYLLALMSWETMLFSDSYTVTGLMLSLFLLAWVLYGGSGLAPSKDVPITPAADNPHRRPSGRFQSSLAKIRAFLFPSFETSRGYYLSIYCLAILAVSISAAMYVAPVDRVIVTVNPPDDMRGKIGRVGAVTNASDEEMRVKFRNDRQKAVLMLTKDEFLGVKEFNIYTEDKKRVAVAKKSECRALLTAGLGSRLEVDAEEKKQ